MLGEFVLAVDRCEDAADVVACVGDGTDTFEGLVGLRQWRGKGRFVRVEAKGMTPGEGASASHCVCVVGCGEKLI